MSASDNIIDIMQRDLQYGSPLTSKAISMPGGQYANDGNMYLPFDITSSINSIARYAQSDHTAILLEISRMLLWDGRYSLTIRGIPSTQQQGDSNLIPAYQQFEDQISVASGSFLFGIGAIAQKYNDAIGTTLTTDLGNARIRLYDAGGQEWLSDDFAHINNLGANSVALGSGAPFFLPSPLAISSPGQLNVSAVNLEAVAINLNMGFFFASPKGSEVFAARVSNAGNTLRR